MGGHPLVCPTGVERRGPDPRHRDGRSSRGAHPEGADLDAATRDSGVARLLDPDGEGEQTSGLQADERLRAEERLVLFAPAACRAPDRMATVLYRPI